MPILSVSNTNFQFSIIKLIWRFYITVEALPITKQIELIDKYKFVMAAPGRNSKIFIIHVLFLEVPESAIYPF